MTTENLGQSLSKHRGTFGGGGWLWYLGGVFELGALVTLVKIVNVPPGQSAASIAGNALILMGVGAALLIFPVLRLKQTVEVFEHGFVWTRLIGTRIVPRTAIEEARVLTETDRMGSITRVITTLRDGEEITMSGLEGAEQLANFLRPVATQPANRGVPAQPWSPPNAAAPVQPWSPPNAEAPAQGWSQPNPGAAPGGWKPPGT